MLLMLCDRLDRPIMPGCSFPTPIVHLKCTLGRNPASRSPPVSHPVTGPGSAQPLEIEKRRYKRQHETKRRQ